MNMLDQALDTSWIAEQEKLLDVQNNYCREPMEHITVHSLFINQNHYIENIHSEHCHCDVSNNQSVLTQDQLMRVIESMKRKYTEYNKKYRLYDIQSFVVDVDPKHIQPLSQQPIQYPSPFFKPASRTADIIIPNSIFIFHSINAIYLIFWEIPHQTHSRTLKSILKKKKTDGSNTKKVHIREPGSGSRRHKRNLQNKTKRKISF
jgi:hypothetical protein